MNLGELWHRWRTRGYPEQMITKVEATERVRQYAKANDLDFLNPVSIHVEQRALNPEEPKAGSRFVYVMILGTTIPMPRVEVDVSDGTVVLWRSFLR